MGKCCTCLLTEAVISHAWVFLEVALENHKGLVLGSLVLGSLTAAVYYAREAQRLDEELCSVSECLGKVEDENHLLRLRARSLHRRHSGIQEAVTRAEHSRCRAEALSGKLKREDSLARAEMGALGVEVRSLYAQVVARRRERDGLRERLQRLVRFQVTPPTPTEKCQQ